MAGTLNRDGELDPYELADEPESGGTPAPSTQIEISETAAAARKLGLELDDLSIEGVELDGADEPVETPVAIPKQSIVLYQQDGVAPMELSNKSYALPIAKGQPLTIMDGDEKHMLDNVKDWVKTGNGILVSLNDGSQALIEGEVHTCEPEGPTQVIAANTVSGIASTILSRLTRRIRPATT